MITFVTYYVVIDKSCEENIHEACKGLRIGGYIPIKYPEMYISTMFQSARKYHPDGRFILITDQFTQLDLPDFIEIVRIKNPDEHLEVAKYIHLPEALDLATSDNHIILLDQDIIINANLESLFSYPGDLYFTYQKDSTKENVMRPNQSSMFPINIGVVGISKDQKERAFNVLMNLVLQIKKIQPKCFSYWFGLQLLLKKLFVVQLLKCEKEGLQQPYIFDFQGTKLSFVDAEIYNYQPNSYLHVPITTKIVHFKGRSKPFMLDYWKQLSRQTSAD